MVAPAGGGFVSDRATVFAQLTDCLRKVRDHIEREKCECTRRFRCKRCVARGQLTHVRLCAAVLLQEAEPEFSMKIRQEPGWVMCECGRNLMDKEDRSGCYRCRVSDPVPVIVDDNVDNEALETPGARKALTEWHVKRAGKP